MDRERAALLVGTYHDALLTIETLGTDVEAAGGQTRNALEILQQASPSAVCVCSARPSLSMDSRRRRSV